MPREPPSLAARQRLVSLAGSHQAAGQLTWLTGRQRPQQRLERDGGCGPDHRLPSALVFAPLSSSQLQPVGRLVPLVAPSNRLLDKPLVPSESGTGSLTGWKFAGGEPRGDFSSWPAGAHFPSHCALVNGAIRPPTIPQGSVRQLVGANRGFRTDAGAVNTIPERSRTRKT